MSMHYLAQGCTFLLAGSLADALGSRKAFLVGCILQNLCFMSSGSAQSGMELITSRILSGIAYPMCFISAMNIHREILPVGKLQNRAVDYTRRSQYLGSAVGIVLSASLSVSGSWRWGFHSAAILGNLTLLLSSWAIPKPTTTKRISWSTLTEEIDWGGTLLAGFLMALLFYALASVPPRKFYLDKYSTNWSVVSSRPTWRFLANRGYSFLLPLDGFSWSHSCSGRTVGKQTTR